MRMPSLVRTRPEAPGVHVFENGMLLLLLVLSFLTAQGPAMAQGANLTVRVGHFPNITHVQALVAQRSVTKKAMARHGG